MKHNLEWFEERIAKRIWRTEGTCPCETCESAYEYGLVIGDKEHAAYINMMQNEIGVFYFDSKKERDEFESKGA